MKSASDPIIVIGAGMGGMAAAIRLAAAGRSVLLLEAHDWTGGKMRTTPSSAGPVDAGPTVLTLRDVFDDLFAVAGKRLDDHVTLTPLPRLARHFWTDGMRLDLVADRHANRDAIHAAFGSDAAQDFARFEADTRALYDAFDAPVMRRARPSVLGAAQAALARPRILPWLMPGRSLDAMLRARLREPRLRQLFGRYATYVGGNPLRAPAVLGLIWQAEAAGVWAVQGGMATLARALSQLFAGLGGEIRLNSPVARLDLHKDRLCGVTLQSGESIACRQAVFAGDPAALAHLAPDARRLPRRDQTHPRSLSAHVWTLAANVLPQGLGRSALDYHNVFFADDMAQEFAPLSKGKAPLDPTIYVCAQDRLSDAPVGAERFQFILNAPALSGQGKDILCPTDPFARLSRFRLHLDVAQAQCHMTSPRTFGGMFPHSQGALYGLSPDGPMATFQRPTARTRIGGLYLAGGGVHPGAGVPMAALSGQHAARAALGDPISASMSRPMAMPGGISTGSAIAARAPFRSSAS